MSDYQAYSKNQIARGYMSDLFFEKLLTRHTQTPEVPSTELISGWANELLTVLFPEVTEKRMDSVEELKNTCDRLRIDLVSLLYHTRSCDHRREHAIAEVFFENIEEVYQDLLLDIDAFVHGDPAALSSFEVIRSYPGFYAIYIYRIAHILHMEGVPLVPRILSEYAHSRTGIDIHPAAFIGKSFFIDHGTGVVIGETTYIGDHVKIYQGVTLGALSIDKKMAGIKRHPTVQDDVIIYSGATILGGETVVGSGSVIGGNVWITSSVPPGTKVYHQAENKWIENQT